MLEEQLDTARKRSEQIVELETSVLKYKQQINDLSLVSQAQTSADGRSREMTSYHFSECPFKCL